MPGPAPKPTALKKLSGNPGKRPLNDGEPQPGRFIPAMPRGMPKRAQRFWKMYADRLDRLGLLTEIDGAAFTIMAIHFGIAWEAMAIIRDEGLVSVDVNGVSRKHPMLQVLRDNSRTFLQYADRFGLTPSARTKINVGGDEEADLGEVLAALMSRL